MNTYRRIAAVIIQDKKILLVRHDNGPADYWTPGGKPDSEETEEETLKRELHEETGLTLTKSTFFQEYRAPSPITEETLDIARNYIAETIGNPTPQAEITSYIWVDKSEIKKYLLTPTDAQLITDLVKNELL